MFSLHKKLRGDMTIVFKYFKGSIKKMEKIFSIATDKADKKQQIYITARIFFLRCRSRTMDQNAQKKFEESSIVILIKWLDK